MAKWYGKIGYSETVETSPGVWIPQDTVHEYYWDVIIESHWIDEIEQMWGRIRSKINK